MSGKVFISCGQSNRKEKKVAKDISNWLITQGYQAYVAIQVQSILEINNDIINELKSSDFYLFINFKRERLIRSLKDMNKSPIYRGSLFTNQELGIAYAMGFEKMLFFNQKHVAKEGLFGYIASNTPEFKNYNQVLKIVQNAIASSNWDPKYSRNLIYQNLIWSSPLNYLDNGITRHEKVLFIDIVNNRADKGALNAIARLISIKYNGNIQPSPDKSHLKCTGTRGYSNTIWPQDHVAFDLLSIDLNTPTNINLHSSLDVVPRVPIISQIGIYELEFEVYAESFPVLIFKIKLNLTGNVNTTNAILS